MLNPNLSSDAPGSFDYHSNMDKLGIQLPNINTKQGGGNIPTQISSLHNQSLLYCKSQEIVINNTSINQYKTIEDAQEKTNIPNPMDKKGMKNFRQEFLAQVRKLSKMVIIYDSKNKYESQGQNSMRSRKRTISNEQQFHIKIRNRSKTLGDYCENQTIQLLNRVNQKSPEIQQQERKQKRMNKQFKRYMKLSKIKDIKLTIHEDQKKEKETSVEKDKNQLKIGQNQCSSISTQNRVSPPKSRVSTPAPTNIIIQNLKSYIQHKNKNFLPLPNSDILYCYHKRNRKLLLSKNLRLNTINSNQPSQKKINVNNLLKCNSIHKQNYKNIYNNQLNVEIDEGIRYQKQQQLKRNSSEFIEMSRYQHSNLIKNIARKKYSLAQPGLSNSRKSRNQQFISCRAHTEQIPKKEMHKRNNTIDLGNKQQSIINYNKLGDETLEYIIKMQRLRKQQKQKQLLKKQQLHIAASPKRLKQKIKRQHFLEAKKQEYSQIQEDNKISQLEHELGFKQEINQWSFKNTLTEHFNQYFIEKFKDK